MTVAERTYIVNLGGTAEVISFCPMFRDKSFFLFVKSRIRMRVRILKNIKEEQYNGKSSAQTLFK